jgi:hypothetical protein
MAMRKPNDERKIEEVTKYHNTQRMLGQVLYGPKEELNKIRVE